MQALADLYLQHLAGLKQTYERLLAQEPAGTVAVLHSGSLVYRFADDQPYPFEATPHFQVWLPLNLPECFLVLRLGETPVLYYWQPEDFWYEPPQAPEGFWAALFDIRVVQQVHQVFADLNPQQCVYLGSNEALARDKGFKSINPDDWVHPLNYARTVKSAYEIACIREANEIGIRGHQAAYQAFEAGASEYAIHNAFLEATGQLERQCPYSTIVALGAHSSILHYEGKCPAPQGSASFLIDAGARLNGYCSDITRTYAQDSSLFSELIQRMDQLQRNLVAAVKPGITFLSLHEQAHQGVAAILQETGLVKLSVDTLFEQDITSTFFPHGLGHLLGIQVHDVAGHYQDETGQLKPPPKRYPFLRFTHVLRLGQVFTVEPGFYLIPSLLEKLRVSEHAQAVDWSLVEHLLPYGGIRIEDNIAVTADGSENLTRSNFIEQLM
ncbi:Xaa-Pro dipeptidase [Leptolyngbya sp. FACHB-261]|uniref:Xaa-Pro dipeptidase n=1 Tax=Leptolyngbya sp. FACHB-261 TaxID=2692806 RepID=UPI001686E619|nr:Xaa-Pro dipeptidase [Leptolyngbya sp. FACHB-261]MBD2100620.1 Xaa-Pro dipeptidase [Leptolyngbya sp. FACHB-261]